VSGKRIRNETVCFCRSADLTGCLAILTIFGLLTAAAWPEPPQDVRRNPSEVVKAYYRALEPKEGSSGAPANPDALRKLFLPEMDQLVSQLQKGPCLGDSLRQRGFRWFLRDVNVVEQSAIRCVVEATLVVTSPSELWKLGMPTITQRFHLLQRSGLWMIAELSLFRPITCHGGAGPEQDAAILKVFDAYVKASTAWDEDALWNLASADSQRLLGRDELLRLARSQRIRRLQSQPQVEARIKDRTQKVVRVPSAEVVDANGNRKLTGLSVGFTPEGDSWNSGICNPHV